MNAYEWLTLIGVVIILLIVLVGYLHTQKQKMEVLEILEHRGKVSEGEILTDLGKKTLTQLRQYGQSLQEQNFISVNFIPNNALFHQKGGKHYFEITTKGIDYIRDQKARRGIVD